MAIPIITGKLHSTEKVIQNKEVIGVKMMVIDGNNMAPQFIFIGVDYAKSVFKWLKVGMYAVFSVRSSSPKQENRKKKDGYYTNFVCIGVTNAHEVVPFEKDDDDEIVTTTSKSKTKIAPKKAEPVEEATETEDASDIDELLGL